MPALQRSTNGTLALHYAAARGCLDCVKLLIKTTEELSANTQMDNDVTPVYLAAQEGHLEVLKFLVLEAGGSLYVRAKDGMAPLHAAAQMGCLTCLKWMVQDQGVDPNLRDGDGATPLHFAASRGHVDTVRWLLRHGGRLMLDKYGKSPINDAAENEQIECLNIMVQHGAAPDYPDNDDKRHCTCRKGDFQQRCSSACVNYSSPRAPFFLHPPLRADSPPHDGLYVNPMASQDSSNVSSGCSTGSDSFFLHNPQEVVYNRVKDLFDERRDDITPTMGLSVQVEVHSSSSGAGSEENLSSSEMSDRSVEHEHDYEDIYHLTAANRKKGVRSRSRDSGSHSQSGSISSTNSGAIIVKLMPTDQPSMTPSTESGVSSASPSDLGHSEEEGEKTKVSHRHSLPHQHPYNRQLKRVVSEPGSMCPPPPPPLPPVNDIHEPPQHVSLSRTSSSSIAHEDSVREESTLKPSDFVNRKHKETVTGAKPNQTDEVEVGECDTSSGTGLVNRQLVLPFIPPKFNSNGDDCLIKPSEYLKSIGGTRVVSQPNGAVANRSAQKCYIKGSEQKSSSLEESKEDEVNSPPPPPLPSVSQKETTSNAMDGSNTSKPKKHQPLSAISIHDLNSVQLRRTDKAILQKTMSTPVKSSQSGTEPFQAQKQDLIAELKLSRDIEGVKKMKVERAKTEEKHEKELVSEISKQLTANNLLEQIPEKDATGNAIPPWKRQMMAKKAAEKARKDLEEQLKKEAEEKRLQAIPAWKRQLLAKKEENENRSTVYTPKIVEDKKVPQVLLKINVMTQPQQVPSNEKSVEENNKENSQPFLRDEVDEVKEEEEENDSTQIIPWRAQLRKTNSKLNLLD